MPARGITLTISAETAEAVQKMGAFFNAVSNGLGKITALAGPAALALLGFRGIHEISELTHQVLDLGSALKNLQARTGGAIPDLLVLRRQLKEAGGGAESAGIMLNYMQRSIVQAAEEGGSTAKIFTDLKLAISLGELSALSATQQYKVLGAAIAAIENPAKRAEAVMKIFGRGGGELTGVFSNPEKFKAAFAVQTTFGEVMARSAERFHEIEVTMGRLADNGKRFTAGFLSQITTLGSQLSQTLGEIDLTALGQRFGALVVVIVNSWKESRFPEMVGLLIEAGFEIGTNAAKTIFSGWWTVLIGKGAGSIYLGLINAIITFGVDSAKFLIDVLLQPVTYLSAGFDWLYDQIRVGFATAFNWIKDNVFTPTLNWFVARWNAMARVLHAPLLDQVKTNTGAVAPGKSFSSSLDQMKGLTGGIAAGATGYLDSQLAATRSFFGIGAQAGTGDNTKLTAVQRLNALIQEQIDKFNKLHIEEEKGVPIQSRLGALREVERLSKEKLLVLDEQLANIETDFRMTNVDKYEKKRQILVQQSEALVTIIAALKERAQLEDSTTAEATLGRADTFSKDLNQKNKAIGQLGADPNSFSDQFSSTMKDLGDQWGTWAQQTAQSFKTVFNSAISSISNGITGLILGTKTWGQALREIGTSILTSVIQAIIQMGVRWVLTQLMMAVAGKAIQAAAVAASTPIALAQAGIWAVPATLATIASYGAAALAAPGFIAEAEAVTLGLSALGGAFAEGGYTGDGPRSQVAGVVHRGEVVFSGPDIERAGGLDTVEALRSGRRAFQGGAAVGAPPNIHNDNQISFAVFDDKHRMQRFLESSEGQAVLVDLWSKNAHRFK